MAPWLEPNGPLNYRQVEELIVWLTASSEVTFEYEPATHEAGAEVPEPEVIAGWRDPNWQPGPEDTPPPDCWKAPAGLVPAGSAATTTTPTTSASAAPTDGEATPVPATGGTADAPRVIRLDATATLQFTDESGAVVPQIEVVPGETIEFVIDNTAGFDHNFWIGTPDVLSVPNAETDVGHPTWQSGEQSVTWTVPEDAGDLQFACTVPGHYTTMHGTFVIQG
jgi:uncharacterized cupredoxin-like copper-binding protein